MLKKIISLLSASAIMTGIVISSLPRTVKAVNLGNQSVLKTTYSAPALDWESEALPIGNGFMGGMVFGGVEIDRIQTNEHTLWSGGPGKAANYNTQMYSKTTPENVKSSLNQLQRMIQNEVSGFSNDENKAAHVDPDTGEIVTNDYLDALYYNNNQTLRDLLGNLSGQKWDFGSYQTLSDIYISDIGHPKVVSSNAVMNGGETAEDESQSNISNNLFDTTTATRWLSYESKAAKNNRVYFPVTVDWEYDRSFKIDSYQLFQSGENSRYDPSKWEFQASVDGISYVKLDERENQTFNYREGKTYNVTPQDEYKYYRLIIKEGANGTSSARENAPGLSRIVLNSVDPAPAYTGYSRELDIDNALASVQYTKDEVTYKREYFTSYPDNIMAIRLSADELGKINQEFSINSPQPNKTITIEGDTITMTGWSWDHVQVKKEFFAQQLKVIPIGGTMSANENYIEVKDADEVMLLMSAKTNYVQCMDNTFNYFSNESMDDLVNTVKERLDTAAGKGYEKLYKDHVKDYGALFSRVKLSLNNAVFPQNKTTDQLLTGYKNGSNTDAENRYLEILYYQFGRYLLIASSREGSLPANLQGIWAQGLLSPWDSDYHTNINLQMNYWLAEQTNLSECHTPMLEYIKSLIPRGTISAKYFQHKPDGGDVRGWTVYHENNIWGYVGPATGGSFYFPTGGAWLTQHIWDHYAFTADEKFLEDNYRALLDAALFWVDSLWEDERDGTLVSNPSCSPEHGPYSLGASSDQTIIWELFNNVIKASEVLGKPSDEIEEIKEAQTKLWLPQIGLNGQYMEWKDETTLDVTGEDETGSGSKHRHVNHLFAVHPGTLVSAGRSETDDEFVEAMKVTLNTRGDGGTGWSKAWKINFWARLRDGDHAGTMVNQIIKESTMKNLFDTHAPFQIDGNFGATAGMTEMLMQSQGDTIDLMAAVPSMWHSGSVSGLKARGNFEIGMDWVGGMLQEASVKSLSGGECAVRYAGLSDAKVIKQSSGQEISFEVTDNNTVVFETQQNESYLIINIPQDVKNPNPKQFLRATVNNLHSTAVLNKTNAPEEIGDNGVYIESLSDTSYAKYIGLKENDIITKVNGYDAVNTPKLTLIYNAITQGEEIILKVWREDRYIQIVFIKDETNDMLTVPGLIQAEDYDVKRIRKIDAEGREEPRTENSGDTGGTLNISNTGDNDWWLYKDVNFAEAPTSITFRCARPDSGIKSIEMFIDSTAPGDISSTITGGTKIATASFELTGGWQTYISVEVPVTENVTGKHDVYLRTPNGGMNINWFSINSDYEEPPELEYTGPDEPAGDLYLVDKTILSLMVESAEIKYTEDILEACTENTVEGYRTALAEAKDILEDQTQAYEQSDVSTAETALRAAIKNLAQKGNVVIEPEYQKGDPNNDKTINIFDIMVIRDHIFGKATLVDEAFDAADVNEDEDVNIFDIMAIRDHIFGKSLIIWE